MNSVVAEEAGGYTVVCKDASYTCENCIISVGRSGSKWMEKICDDLEIPTKSNRVDIGVRVELPAVVFAHLTDELYESKIVYRTEKYGDRVRTFCMNPKGAVVNENTNGIITVNGHSYEDPEKQTENTNFALLVAKHFSEPFKDSNGYGESIARLSNMLGGGVIVQRFGDLIRGRRSTQSRIDEAFITPTLSATPGDLSLVLPKRILDGIIEMIYALDKIAPGTRQMRTHCSMAWKSNSTIWKLMWMRNWRHVIRDYILSEMAVESHIRCHMHLPAVSMWLEI